MRYVAQFDRFLILSVDLRDMQLALHIYGGKLAPIIY